MVGPTYDCLTNPLGAVRSTFDKAMAGPGASSALDGKDWGAAELFHHFLSDHSQVPLINQKSMGRVPPRVLVRFRGMIQDMLGNEFYVGAYKDEAVWRTNKYSDVSQFPMGGLADDAMRIWERRLLLCVPVPGLSPWAEEASDEAIERYLDLMSQQREKRSRMDSDATEGSAEYLEDLPSAKKMKEEDNNHSLLPSSSICSKAGVASSCAAPDAIPDSFSCLVKVYDTPESDLKLNEVFEFIGVLAFDPEFTPEDEDGTNEEHDDDMLVHLPSIKVPHLHCIVHRKLAINDFLTYSPATEPKLHVVKEIREALLRQLTSVLGNDGLAAHFMLLHLLSKVYTGANIGKLALNLTGFNKESVCVFGSQLHATLESLLPFRSSIPLTTEYLNTASLVPKKDYQVNRLMPGVLQLAESSHIIIDETHLEAGTLNSVGIENAKALKYLVEFQKVEYDFVYYKMEMAANVQVLVLSEAKSNISPADVVLPFQPTCGSYPPVAAAEALATWRWYLATMKSLPHSIDSEMQEVVERDMVAAIQADRSLSSEDFSRWLTMGRLISASFGETSLSLEHWQMVKELERLRRERRGIS